MLGDRNVRDAERQVATQKLRVRERWDELRARGRDAAVSPGALIAFALVGGIAGWRSRRPTRIHHAPAPRGLLRGIASGLLQSVASIAIEDAFKNLRRQAAAGRNDAAGNAQL